MWLHMMSGSSGARVPLAPFLGFGEATTTVTVVGTVAATATATRSCNFTWLSGVGAFLGLGEWFTNPLHLSAPREISCAILRAPIAAIPGSH